MPYITPPQRTALDAALKAVEAELAPAKLSDLYAGELAYLLTRLCLRWLERRRYQDLALLDGIIGTVHHEFRRRVLVPYEDARCKEHGDVTDMESTEHATPLLTGFHCA